MEHPSHSSGSFPHFMQLFDRFRFRAPRAAGTWDWERVPRGGLRVRETPTFPHFNLWRSTLSQVVPLSLDLFNDLLVEAEYHRDH